MYKKQLEPVRSAYTNTCIYITKNSLSRDAEKQLRPEDTPQAIRHVAMELLDKPLQAFQNTKTRAFKLRKKINNTFHPGQTPDNQPKRRIKKRLTFQMPMCPDN